MKENRKLKTTMKLGSEQDRAAQWHLTPFRYNAGLPRASKGILPALLLLASPFSGADTTVFSHARHLPSRLEQCRHYGNE